MEQIKHECGVALIRLLKPLEYYREKYGTAYYGLNKLYLLMEKQHNRGQEAAGVGCIDLDAPAGTEYIWRERALGAQAIQEIFSSINHRVETDSTHGDTMSQLPDVKPFLGQIYMGHLRYSTTGRSGMNYVHPFLRRNNWRSRTLMLCGNFNMTNVRQIFDNVVSRGQHPRLYSDTVLLLEQIGYALDRENTRLHRQFAEEGLTGIENAKAIEQHLDLRYALRSTASTWDGGYVICGAVGSGDVWALRDPNGIRPAFYYVDDEIVVVASERPVIQTTINVPLESVKELEPGCALMVDAAGKVNLERILPEGKNERCSFERIYFSRGSDAAIYQERKALGRCLVPDIIAATGGIEHLRKTVFSFIPNTAEVAFIGMVEGLEQCLDNKKSAEIAQLAIDGKLTQEKLASIMAEKLRIEKLAIKDIKLRTFIAEGNSRNDLAAHVYDVTYGLVRDNEDTIVVIDDSIVRGTTLKESILRMLDRLQPRKIVVVSSSPQVRYPDCYGIDMSRMGEFCAFRAAVSLLKKSGRQHVLENTYRRCLQQEDMPDNMVENCVKEIYASFTDKEISDEIALMLKPADIKAEVEIVYQSIEGLHKAVPGCPGDWYFSGNYPTVGGIRLVNRAYVNYYEGNFDKR
ncbi:MAG: amidophosphoribosyltransferase [Muribaculum sp.]|nr:amidophosphoribosyltransferase [Muribaculaceae bacterium]MCM1081576.1 amidophosphoribosyltransferase [Muribaculum sp.]